MASALPEIERLVEDGLARYGQGDLDGALAAWEEALELDPHHEQALGYLDYVRLNYELLMSEVSGHGEAPPFAIADEELEPDAEPSGKPLPAATAVPRAQSVPDGWAIADEPGGLGAAGEGDGEVLLELEADEPGEHEGGVGRPPTPTDDEDDETLAKPQHVLGPDSGGISFDDATSEYQGAARGRTVRDRALSPAGRNEFRSEATPTPGFVAEPTPGFGTPADLQTPPGFSTQPTELRRRDLGFVQPADREHRRASPSAQELQVSLRTPPLPRLPGLPAPPAGPLPIGAAPTLDLSRDLLDLDPPTIERSPIVAPHDPTADLVGARATVRHDDLRGKGGSTRDLPGSTRRPGPTAADLPGGRAVTPTDFAGPSDTRDFDVPTERKATTRPSVPPPPPEPPHALATAPTRDLADLPKARPTTVPPADARSGPVPRQPPLVPLSLPLPASGNPLVSAPTRDLGLRAAAAGFPRDPGRPESSRKWPRVSDDAVTGRADVREVLRAAERAERGELGPSGLPGLPAQRAPATLVPEPTREDLVLPFDPIDARSAQILDEIDVGAPADEAAEDRTRRRVTTLFDRATGWVKAGELERAVAAIDLALSEDPNSALGQKLIHRHRDTIMAVFQTFLGDLQRTPMLARPLHELGAAPISPRAAFLLSRVDGLLSIDEILDVSGMPRLEAYRYLCQLFLRGILR